MSANGKRHGLARRAVLGVLMVLAVLAPTASPASADVSDPDEAGLREFWTEYGVTPQVQDALLEKLETTGAIDALVGDLSTAVTTTRQTATTVVTIYTFPDGSVTVLASQRPHRPVSRPGVITPMSTVSYTGCTTTSGSGWVHYAGCTLEIANGVVHMKYKVTWEKYSTGPAQILSSGTASAGCTGGTCTAPFRALWRPAATSSLDAVVKYRTVYTSSLQQYTVYLSFWVSYNGTWSVTES